MRGFLSPKPANGIGYILRTLAFGDLSRIILLAEIRLYANTHSPVYHVVVGDVIGRNEVSVVWNKLGDGETTRLSLPRANDADRSTQAHWEPYAWPLPA